MTDRPILIDKFQRRVRKLRISVTDRCNFRCLYCMPAGEIPWLERSEILSFEEITRVARVCVDHGVEKIRLTGGEPLARQNMEDLIAQLRAIPNLKSLSMTTNGYFLPKKAAALRRAGLDSVNISLDTLDADRFKEITRRDYFDDVLAGISAAKEVGFDPVKVNAVVMRGFNDDEIADFVRWGHEVGVMVRFIEFMPLDGEGRWNKDTVVPVDEIIAKAKQLGTVEPVNNNPSEPARLYQVDGGNGGVFGIIPTISQPFCRHCDRIRLTAEGRVRNCLFALEETDLKEILRSGADDARIAQQLKEAVYSKWEGHLINRADFEKPDKAMYAIGG